MQLMCLHVSCRLSDAQACRVVLAKRGRGRQQHTSRHILSAGATTVLARVSTPVQAPDPQCCATLSQATGIDAATMQPADHHRHA